MHESTRPATEADLAALVLLSREGRAAIEDVRGGGLWLLRQALPEPLEETFARAIDGPESLIQLGCIDEVPLGFLLVEIDELDGRRLAVARELYVTPAARGVGLGELMMDAALEWARSAGCAGIDGYALPGDRATKNFFETFGMVARGIVVHRPLD